MRTWGKCSRPSSSWWKPSLMELGTWPQKLFRWFGLERSWSDSYLDRSESASRSWTVRLDFNQQSVVCSSIIRFCAFQQQLTELSLPIRRTYVCADGSQLFESKDEFYRDSSRILRRGRSVVVAVVVGNLSENRTGHRTPIFFPDGRTFSRSVSITRFTDPLSGASDGTLDRKLGSSLVGPPSQ